MSEIDEMLLYLQTKFPDRNMYGQGEYDADELIALWKRGNEYRAELNKRPIMIMTEEMYKEYLTELDRIKREAEEENI